MIIKIENEMWLNGILGWEKKGFGVTKIGCRTLNEKQISTAGKMCLDRNNSKERALSMLKDRID